MNCTNAKCVTGYAPKNTDVDVSNYVAKLHIDPWVPQRRCYVLPLQKACAERKDNLISAIFFKLKPLSAIQCVKHHYSVIVFNMYPYAPTVSHI